MFKQLLAISISTFILGGCINMTEKSSTTKNSQENNQMLPPKYLSIDGFKNCLSTQAKGSASFYCMPETKPEQCLDKAWNELNALEGSEKIPSCKK